MTEHRAGLRSIEEIKNGGAAWVTEAELAWICDKVEGFSEALKQIAAEEPGKPGVSALYAHEARELASETLVGLGKRHA